VSVYNFFCTALIVGKAMNSISIDQYYFILDDLVGRYDISVFNGNQSSSP